MNASWLCLCLLLSGAALAQAPQRLTLTTEEYPPYNMSDAQGQVTGVSTEIVRSLLDSAGIGYQVAVYPWVRAIAMARTQAHTCVFSMSRTPEREELYRWIGPLVANDWTLFARSGGSRPRQLEEVQDLRIGSYQGDAIVSYLQTRSYHVEAASSDEVNPRKLLAGRIDYWATGRLIGLYRLKQQGITGIEPVLDFHRTEMYLACHRQLPDETVRQLNLQLQSLHQKGVIKSIYARYGYEP